MCVSCSQPNGGNLTGGGTGNVPATTSYVPFGGGGGGFGGAGFRTAGIDVGLVMGAALGFVGLVVGGFVAMSSH